MAGRVNLVNENWACDLDGSQLQLFLVSKVGKRTLLLCGAAWHLSVFFFFFFFFVFFSSSWANLR